LYLWVGKCCARKIRLELAGVISVHKRSRAKSPASTIDLESV
jgi:hypothetical protein